jgi:hypothetical protein
MAVKIIITVKNCACSSICDIRAVVASASVFQNWSAANSVVGFDPADLFTRGLKDY